MQPQGGRGDLLVAVQLTPRTGEALSKRVSALCDYVLPAPEQNDESIFAEQQIKV